MKKITLLPSWNVAFLRRLSQPARFDCFEQHCFQLFFKRILCTSLFLMFTYPFYIAIDWFFLSGATPQNKPFFFVLAVIHFVPAFLSGLFLVVYKKAPADEQAQLRYKHFWICFFKIVYITAGAAASLNSQFLTQNIYAYLIICAAVAVLFPASPKQLAVWFGLSHAAFLAGLFWIGGAALPVIMDAINSTGAVLIACIVSFVLFSYQKNDFFSQRQLKENEETFRRLFNVNPHPLLLVRLADEHILLFNHQAARYFDDPAVPSPLVPFLFADANEKTMIMKKLHTSGKWEQRTVFRQLPSGEAAWITMNFELVDFQGERALLICMTDVTNFKKTENELYEHAFVDELTGLLNRRMGLDLLQKLLAPEAENVFFTLCYMDLNNLKAVNDLYGHSAGDHYILRCCEAVQSQLQAEDIFFRLGGDEFVMIFPDQSEKQVEAIWEKIKKQLEEWNQLRQFPYLFSASCGLVQFNSGAFRSAEELLEAADREMYKSKTTYKRQHT